MPKKVFDYLVNAHFFFLPFGSLNFGSSYLSINFVTSILIILMVNIKIVDVFKDRYTRGIFVTLLLLWFFFMFNSYMNYVPNTITANSYLRMLTLYVFSFFSLIYYFQKKPYFLITNFTLLNTSIILVTVITLVGIGVEQETAVDRAKVLNMNPNTVASFLVFSFFWNLNELFNFKSLSKKIKFVIILSLNLFLFIRLGSLTALGVLVFGLIFYFFLKSKNVVNFFKQAFLLFILGLPVLYFLLSSNIFSKRLENLEQLKTVSGRADLWELAMFFFQDAPILGSGVYKTVYNVGAILGDEISFHNLYLELLSMTGLLGFIIFILFVKKLYNMAVLYKSKTNSVLGVLFLVMPLILISTSRLSFLFFTLPLLYIIGSRYQKTSFESSKFI